MAPRVGLEPTTKWLHFTHMFPYGVDYIFTRSILHGGGYSGI